MDWKTENPKLLERFSRARDSIVVVDDDEIIKVQCIPTNRNRTPEALTYGSLLTVKLTTCASSIRKKSLKTCA